MGESVVGLLFVYNKLVTCPECHLESHPIQLKWITNQHRPNHSAPEAVAALCIPAREARAMRRTVTLQKTHFWLQTVKYKWTCWLAPLTFPHTQTWSEEPKPQCCASYRASRSLRNPRVKFYPNASDETSRESEAIKYSVALDDLSGGSHNTTMMPKQWTAVCRSHNKGAIVRSLQNEKPVNQNRRVKQISHCSLILFFLFHLWKNKHDGSDGGGINSSYWLTPKTIGF